MLKAQLLIDEFSARGLTLALCESMTAGLVSAQIAEVPGASKVLRGSLVTYATDLKVSVAGVSSSIIAEHSVISQETAREMARGARKVCGSSWAASVTGVAGPDLQDGHPVGEVYVGISGPHWTAAWPAAELVDASRARFTVVDGRDTPLHVLAGDRAQIREAAVDAVLEGLIRVIREQKRPTDR